MTSDLNLPERFRPLVAFGFPVILAALLKGLVCSPLVTPFNADEAIVALMARHINQGSIPIFFYGQYYMGSLDAMILALVYRFFGESILAIRLLQGALYLGTVFTTGLLAKRLLGSYKAALYSGLLAAVPTVNVTLYTTVSLGGYGEMMLIGNLLLLAGIDINKEIQDSEFKGGMKFYLGLAAWGLGMGFAFWVIGLSLIYSIPVIIVMFWNLWGKERKNLLLSALALVLGCLVGSSPWWGTALLERNLAIFTELAGSAISNNSQGFRMLQPLNRALNFLVFGGTVIAGLRPPWSVTWLMLPLIPFALIFWTAVTISGISRLKEKGSNNLWYLGIMVIVFIIGFIFSPYGDDPSGRYFVPLILPMAVFASDMIDKRLGGKKFYEIGLIFFILVFNFGGIIQSRAKNPPGLTTQFDEVAQVDQRFTEQLLTFLKEQEICTGYSNYWVTYPVAFLSREQIIFSPRLPYHQDFRYTERDDRYQPYTDLVRSSDDIAYITTRHPDLDEYLRQQFAEMGISWRERTIGDYTVYYDLSIPIHVEDLGLGATTQP